MTKIKVEKYSEYAVKKKKAGSKIVPAIWQKYIHRKNILKYIRMFNDSELWTYRLLLISSLYLSTYINILQWANTVSVT